MLCHSRTILWASIVSVTLWAFPATAAAPHKPTKYQPGSKGQVLKFLGWSADSRVFGLAATDWSSTDVESTLAVRRVHDAWSTKVVAYFKQSLEYGQGAQTDDDDEKPLPPENHAKVWKKASSKKAWGTYKGKAGFNVSKAARTIGAHTFEVRKVGRAPKGTTVRVKATKGGAKIIWMGKPTTFEDSPAAPDFGDSGKEPQFEVVLKGPAGASRVTTFALPIGADLGCPQSDVRATVRFFAAPDRKRVLILLSSIYKAGECLIPGEGARFRVRAIGPQIRIFYGGAPKAARALAGRLEAKGYPVADISRKRKKIKKARIGVRGVQGTAVGKKLGALLGPAYVVEPLGRKRRWEQVEIYVPSK